MSWPVVLFLLFSLVVAAGDVSAAASDQTALRIKPGPKRMTEEERAIVADPARQMEHGVVLAQEIYRNENLRTAGELRYHLRAKILSAEGRRLADIVLPFTSLQARLYKFWAWAIHPDGSVSELSKKDVTKQFLARVGKRDIAVRRASIPGVEPGCVIDYGFTIRYDGWISADPIPLQQAWPIRRFRYRWIPWAQAPAMYYISRQEDLDVHVDVGLNAILISADNIEPVPSEPMMPPSEEVRSHIYLYYGSGPRMAKEYWDHFAKEVEKETERFGGTRSFREKLLREVGIGEELPLEEKLTRLYDWIATKVKNISLLSAEESETYLAENGQGPGALEEVVARHQGYARQLDRLFAVFGRALGAETSIVLATDRRIGFWKPTLLDEKQFQSWVVAVHLPDAPPDDLTFVDPGSGLPYGQVPWWLTGSPALMATRKGAKMVKIPIPKASLNTLTSQVDLSFSEGNESVVVDWSLKGVGQAGMSRRRKLRRMEPADREKMLFELCGEGGDFEITQARSPGLEETPGDFALECRGEHFLDGLDESADTYAFHLRGVWLEPVPDLQRGERRLPVIFSYPKTAITHFTIHPPEGFAAGSIPAPVAIRSPFGSYRLSVGKAENTYTVDRFLSRKAMWVPAEYYPRLIEFLDAVRRADGTALIFERVAGEKR